MTPTPPRPAPPSWEELDVHAGPVRLHLRRHTGGGAPLLLLHGLGVSGVVWQAFARRLAPAWAALAPDLRGHGESDHPAAGYEPADYAGDVVGLLDALGVERLPVIGHSLGALVAVALAGIAPGRGRPVVLLDPPLDPARRNPDVEEVYRLRHGPPGALEAFLAQGSSAPAAARALAALFRQADDRAFETHLQEPAGARWAWDLAGRITAPVLVVQADPALDGVLGDGAAQAFVARVPHGRLLRLPGARHAVHASHAAQLAEAVLTFLGETLAP